MPRFRCGEFWGHSPNLNLLNDPALNRSADLAVPNRRCGVSSRLPATPLVPEGRQKSIEVRFEIRLP